MFEFFLMLGLALAFTVVEMAITFAVAQRLRNYGIVDIVWSAGFAALALIYLFLTPRLAVAWDASVRWQVLTTMVAVWSLRLSAHLFVRVTRHHPVEDVRYAQLRRAWGAKTSLKMFGFFQLQGFLQVVLSVPFLLVCLNTGPAARPGWLWPLEWAGLVVWLIGFGGEALADRHLAAFRADPANQGKVCRDGLWNWSRHPNYFFEWLIWVGYAVFALGSPLGWLSLLSPLLMGHFLVNVTGIPMTEELSVKSKGDAYREYQRTTSAFVPWFKKTG